MKEKYFSHKQYRIIQHCTVVGHSCQCDICKHNIGGKQRDISNIHSALDCTADSIAKC